MNGLNVRVYCDSHLSGHMFRRKQVGSKLGLESLKSPEAQAQFHTSQWTRLLTGSTKSVRGRPFTCCIQCSRDFIPTFFVLERRLAAQTIKLMMARLSAYQLSRSERIDNWRIIRDLFRILKHHQSHRNKILRNRQTVPLPLPIKMSVKYKQATPESKENVGIPAGIYRYSDGWNCILS